MLNRVAVRVALQSEIISDALVRGSSSTKRSKKQKSSKSERTSSTNLNSKYYSDSSHKSNLVPRDVKVESTRKSRSSSHNYSQNLTSNSHKENTDTMSPPTPSSSSSSPAPDNYDISTEDLENAILSTFEIPHLNSVWLYGSKAFPQISKDGTQAENKSSIYDLILVVDDAEEFHRLNSTRNPQHYNFLKFFDNPRLLANINRCGPGVYFNAFAELENMAFDRGFSSMNRKVCGLKIVSDDNVVERNSDKWHSDDELNNNNIENDKNIINKNSTNINTFSTEKSTATLNAPAAASPTMASELSNQFLINDPIIVKYGVVERNQLLNDLTNWKYMYLAGRAHKPLKRLYFESGSSTTNPVTGSRFERDRKNLEGVLEDAIFENRMKALDVSIKQSFPGSALPKFEINNENDDEILPDQAEFLLLRNICNLSYKGDIRNGIAENVNKVDNIVRGQRGLLNSIYRPMYRNYGNFSSTANFTVSLPEIKNRVFWSSIQQAGKGVATNTVSRTVRYAVAKMRKRFF